MSDEEVDLNAMIQSDRKRHRDERQKKWQQRREQRNRQRESHWQNDRRDRRDRDNQRDRSRQNRRDNRRDRQQGQHQKGRNDRTKEYVEKNKRQLFVESYAIGATGFVSDVSLDDIMKLAKGKKIINIKAYLQRPDKQPLEPGKDNAMSVIINFVSKDDANEFIKEYADKKLDGKTPLEFQFKRGIVSRVPRKNEKEDSESDENDKSGKGKQQEDDQK